MVGTSTKRPPDVIERGHFLGRWCDIFRFNFSTTWQMAWSPVPVKIGKQGALGINDHDGNENAIKSSRFNKQNNFASAAHFAVHNITVTAQFQFQCEIS